MRILVISNLYPSPTTTAGDIVATEIRVRGYRERGHEVHIISSVHSPPCDDPHSYPVLKVVTNTAGRGCLQAKAAKASRFIPDKIANYRRVIKIVRKVNPDVVDIANVAGVSVLSCLPIFQLDLAYVINLADDTWIEACAFHSRLQRTLIKIVSGLDSERLRSVQAITASLHMRRRYESEGFPADILAQIPYGTQVSDSREIVPSTGPVKLLYVGRFVREKGAGILLEAMDIVRKSLGPQDVQLTLLGSTPLGGIDVPAMVRERDSGEMVKLHEPVLIKDIPAILRQFHVLVVPSNWPEPFGLVTINALAEGLPLIVTRVGGLPEIIVHGEHGWIIDPGDKEQLASTIIEAVSDRNRLNRMGEAALKRVAENYTLDRYVDQTLLALEAAKDHRFRDFAEATVAEASAPVHFGILSELPSAAS